MQQQTSFALQCLYLTLCPFSLIRMRKAREFQFGLLRRLSLWHQFSWHYQTLRQTFKCQTPRWLLWYFSLKLHMFNFPLQSPIFVFKSWIVQLCILHQFLFGHSSFLVKLFCNKTLKIPFTTAKGCSNIWEMKLRHHRI